MPANQPNNQQGLSERETVCVWCVCGSVCVCVWVGWVAASQPVAIFDNTFVFACSGASGSHSSGSNGRS